MVDVGDVLGDGVAVFPIFDLLFSSIMWPSEFRGLRTQPVFSPLTNSNLGKICASVLKTTLSSGRKSAGENRR